MWDKWSHYFLPHCWKTLLGKSHLEKTQRCTLYVINFSRSSLDKTSIWASSHRSSPDILPVTSLSNILLKKIHVRHNETSSIQMPVLVKVAPVFWLVVHDILNRVLLVFSFLLQASCRLDCVPSCRVSLVTCTLMMPVTPRNILI